MRKLILILFATMAICNSCSKESSNDAEKFYGTWYHFHEDTDGSTYEGTYTILRNGTFSKESEQHINRTGSVMEYSYNGTWELDNDNTLYWEGVYLKTYTDRRGDVTYESGSSYGNLTYSNGSLVDGSNRVYKKIR